MENVIEQAYLGALNAADADAEDAIDLGASALAAAGGSAGPDGADAASRALIALTDRLVRACWTRGWQPADLVRIARRRLTDGHARLTADLIAAEARTAPATAPPRDPRWSVQLRELDATGPWNGDGTLLDAHGRRERLDRFSAAVSVLELLRLLGRLPRITPAAAPVPAAGTDAARHAPAMLGRIRALLAKAESTDFPEEAEALSSKAQQLMARHSIDEALIADSGGGAGGTGGPGACRIGIDHPYEAAKALLLDAVAAANRCQAVWAGDFGFSTVVGFEPDLEAVELLYTSLLVQADAAMLRAPGADSRGRNGKARHGGSRSKDFRQSFLVAYAGRIRERLADATEQATHEAGLPADRLLPALAARDLAVRDTTTRMFPTTTSHRIKGRDPEGWTHGTAAADCAVLGGDR
ncbi:DUF2786 domain-containing protein [Streptomyces sp. H10-C2]|uniref:DUF2786 domain-containing protein n=1 Tax=unclassified Streptomyces TaxID=2593676 RepID=UPI0024B95174|nr:MULTISPECIES: DUF2786 domain-containing protein [unclassified Streptomyces]MDJ0344004.1 DUF2786 domain-containing protein [Streptomyces sp. PH10-H1]MDJ0373505.1 DUF2786 domain-containing protein [Streptomyces sp. H10-C2]